METNKILKAVQREHANAQTVLKELRNDSDMTRGNLLAQEARSMGLAVASWIIDSAVRNNTQRDVLMRYLRENMGEVTRQPSQNRNAYTEVEWEEGREGARDAMRYVSGLLDVDLTTHEW